MANNIKGITVEIGGNTAPLNNALKDVNKTSRDLQSELKEVNKQLKLDPTNTALLTQRQELLAQSVSNTRGKLETLKEAQRQVEQQFAQGNIGEEQYRALQREVIATEQQLRNLESQASRSNVVLSRISTTSREIGDAASNVAGKMAPVTLGIVAVGTAAEKMGSDFIESTNKVDVAFGKSAESVKKWSKTTLDNFGLASGTALDMAAGYGDMATSMGLSQDAAAKMSEKLVGLGGDLASFKNIGIGEANTALTGVFTGETESLKKLGIVMTQTNLLQYAQENGILKTSKSSIELQQNSIKQEKAQKSFNDAVKKYGENSLQARDAKVNLEAVNAKANETAKASLDTLSQSELVQLRYNYVLEKTKNAQGDFAKTSDGAANSTRVAGESVKEAAASIGVILAPVIAKAAQYVASLAKNFSGLDDSTKKVILIVLGLIAAIAPVAKLIQGITVIVGAATTVFGTISGAIALYTGAVTTASTASTILAGAITFITGPIGITITIIAALVAGFVLLWNKCDGFRNFWIGLWNGIKAKTKVVVDSLVGFFTVTIPGAWNSLVSFFTGIPAWFSNLWNGIKTTTENIWNGIKDFFSAVWNGIVAVVMAIVNPFITGITNIFNSMKAGFVAIFEGIKLYFTGVWNAIKTIFLGAILLIIDLCTGNFTKLKEDAIAIFNKLKEAFGQIWDGIKLIFTGVVTAISGFLKLEWNGIVNIAKTIFNVLKTFFSGLWSGIKNTAVAAWNGLKTTVVNICTSIVSGAKGVWNGLLSWFRNLPGQLLTIGSNMFTYMKNGVTSTIGNVKNAVISGITAVIDWIKALPSEAVTWGKDMIMGIVDGIKGAASAVGDAVKGVAQDIRKFLHFSVPDEGPLADYESWMPDFMGGMAKGIEKSKSLVTNAVKSLATDVNVGMQLNPAMASVGITGKELNQDTAKQGDTNINFNGNYSFRDEDDIDYFMNKAGLLVKRRKG